MRPKARAAPGVATGATASTAVVPASPAPLVAAIDDAQLVAAWLSRPGLSPRTTRHAGKEAERFLLWCAARGQCLRDVRFEDLAAYSAFVMDPQPAERWIARTRFRRVDSRWRPFAGPLSVASHRQAIIIIKGLFRWATAAQYLAADPAALLGRMTVAQPETVTRFLPPSAIALMLVAAERMPGATAGQALRRARSRFLVKLFYLTAARLGEVAGADMKGIRLDHLGHWWLHVVGKGGKPGRIPAPADLVAEFVLYRTAFGLPPLPAPGDTSPLILTATGAARRASEGAIAKMVKQIMAGAAELAREMGNHAAADRLGQASPHWLRHSSLTHQVDAGVPLKTVQLNARHASIAVTGRYVHKEHAARHAETVAALRIVPL